MLEMWLTHLAPAELLIGSMISTFGIVNSLTLSYSRLPLAMAEAGDAPRIFGKKLANGAPWVSIVACGLLWATVLIALRGNFDRLLMLDILLYGVSLILEFIALVVLRVREPQLIRPFKVPGGLFVATLLGLPPTALLILAFIRNRNEQLGPISSLNLALIFMAAGVVFYFLAVRRRNTPTQAASAD